MTNNKAMEWYLSFQALYVCFDWYAHQARFGKSININQKRENFEEWKRQRLFVWSYPEMFKGGE